METLSKSSDVGGKNVLLNSFQPFPPGEEPAEERCRVCEAERSGGARTFPYSTKSPFGLPWCATGGV